ncbi:hypothetical protein [Desulfovibrio cuneatus]|uniref:hypothetical protein n=1 Tax=Desulfovibrio cuneatus TaxID=159728 RepID=UPI0003FD2387|nr:hypothetical protein [Desulfovibrio cuneatus]
MPATITMDETNTFEIMSDSQGEALAILVDNGLVKCERCDDAATHVIANGDMAGIVVLCDVCFTESQENNEE